MDYSAYESFLFPEKINIDIVYIIGVNTESDFHPFYVGQSSRHVGRFGDYLKPNFSAATDFKVGKAIEYLTNNGCKVEVKFRSSINRISDEKEIINSLNPILNTIPGYDYTKLQDEDDKKKILSNIEEIMRKWIESSFTSNINDITW